MTAARLVAAFLAALALPALSACPHSPQQGGHDAGPADGAQPPVDAALPDAVASDAAPSDAAAPDAASPDAATSDAALPDAAPPADAFVPDPIPALADEPEPLCANPSPTGDFQFLDDTCGAKVFPTNQDRALACPVTDPSPVIPLAGGGSVTYLPSTSPVVFDDTSLSGLLPAGIQLTVILIRRVGGVPHYRYLSNGTAEQAFQPWSTSKFLAAANAASWLRIQSSYTVGLTAGVDGYPLGDLVTSLHNYDYDPYSSNSLGRYFHNIGGRARANDLIHALWLDRPVTETFGGNYGEAAPPLGYTFLEPGGASVTLTPDSTTGPANNLSAFTLAEALERLALHREEAGQRLPGLQWLDLRVLFYGAEASAKYGPWGGMSADKTIYIQSGHDMAYLEARSQGQWRIFSKDGLGTSGQFLNVGYACFPVLDPLGQPVPGWGRELVIATHLPTGGTSWADRDRILARTYRKILIRVIDGRL